MMMSGMCASVQAELDTLFGQLKGMAVRSQEVSAQAFSKARKGFSADVFRLAGRLLLALAQPRIDAARWNGLRVVAADALPAARLDPRQRQLPPTTTPSRCFCPGPS